MNASKECLFEFETSMGKIIGLDFYEMSHKQSNSECRMQDHYDIHSYADVINALLDHPFSQGMTDLDDACMRYALGAYNQLHRVHSTL